LRFRDGRQEWRRLVATFWSRYRHTVDSGDNQSVNSASTTGRAVRHLAGCLLARVDGKSTVDYLTEPWQLDFIRQIALEWFEEAPLTLDHALDAYFD
ncbi:MAG: hypothetical protein B7Z55_18335, partial [Planctomycetales bacterium 12-60-4]